jgi:hypothetical protein
MGILGIVDTFLIYLIASKRFSQRIGFVSSLLFAVMPLTWMTRRVYLDSLLLPFLLLSILLALYSINSKSETRNFLIWMSGIFLGIAIFTKIPVVTMIPLVIYIIFSKKKIKLTSLTYFLVPVFLISLLWPGYALITGNLNDFLDGVFFQLNREDKSVIKSFKDLLEIDPVLIVLGCVGLFYGLFRKDLLFVLWFLPFTLLLFFLNYSSWFHWILILPMFCISAGKLISDISFLIGKNFKHHKLISQNAIITEIIIFGFICTTMLITTDVTTPFFESTSFVLNYVSENKKISNTNMTIITGPSTSWIFKNTFHHDEILMNYRSGSYIHNKKIILVGDNQLREILSEEKENTLWQIKRLKEIYLKTVLINSFDDHNKVDQKKDIYPYTNFRFSSPSTPIEIRGN